MKKKVFLLLGIVVFLFCGCSMQSKLNVYVVQEDALYENAVIKYVQDNPKADLNVEYFENYDQVNERLKTELLSCKGPDVILFNSFYSNEDPYKLAASGSLLQLDDMVEGLSEGEYFKEILDAGILNGGQYFVPLSWNILQAYSTQETINTNEAADIYEAFEKEEEALKDVADVGISSLQLLRNDMVNTLFEATGTKIFDEQTGEIVADKEKVLKAIDFTKILFDDTAKRKEITTKYSKDFAGAVSHLKFMLENFSFLNNARYYETLYPAYTGDEMFLSTFEHQDGEGMTAQVVQYGAINANTKNAEEAWALLKYILDMPATMNFAKYELDTAYYAPVKKDDYQKCVENLKSQVASGPNMKVGPLSENYAEYLNNVPNDISEAVIPNVTFGKMLQECLMPYMKGEATFEKCYDTLIQRTNLYLTE